MSDTDPRITREKSLQKRIADTPGDLTARLELALLFVTEGREQEALDAFAEASRVGPNDPDVVSMFSRFLITIGHRGAAGELTYNALEENPMELVLLKAHASALQALGDFDEAVEALELARSQVTDDPALDSQLVECYISNGDTEEAVALATENLQRHPECPVRFHSLGRALWAIESYSDARDALTRSLEIIPSLSVLLDLCGVLTDMDQVQEAIELLQERAPGHENSAEYSYTLGNLYADSSQPEKAIQYYMRAVSQNPRHFHALNNLALLLQDRDAEPEEVESFFRRALDANPEDTYANLNYGNFLLVRGRREEAIGHYSKVIANDPYYYQARLAYAQTLIELGRRAEAVSELRQVAREPELNSDEIASIGSLLVRADEEEEGERLLRRAVKLGGGESFTAFEYLGDFYLERSRVGEAVECYFKAILVDPTDTAIWLKAVGNLVEYRDSSDVCSQVQRYLETGSFEGSDGKEDEVVRVLRVINEAAAYDDPSRLSFLEDAAWEMKQPALIAVLAKLHAFFGEEQEAERAFRAAAELAPRDLAIRREYIGWLINVGDIPEAKSEVERAMEVLPGEPMLYNDLGLVLFELGDVAEAREIFLKLSREHSTEATYVYNYAWMLYRDKTDMREIACEVLSKFLDTAGFDVESAFFLAQIIAEMRRQEKFPHAMDLLRKVLSVREEHHSAWTLLGWLQEESGDLRAATHSYSRALKIAPNDVNVLLSAAGFYSSVMRFADAAKLLIRAEQIAPTNEDVLVERARLLQAQGDYGDSVLPLKRLFLLDPESYAFHLACTLYHLGDTEEAAKVVSGLIVKPVTRMNSIARGWYQFLIGETEKAIDDTIAGMKEYAEVVDFRNLAVFCLSLNRVDKAGDALRQFIANVHQPLDLFFFVRDLEEYASRFPSRAADEFKLALLIKLREMMATVVGSAPGAAKP